MPACDVAVFVVQAVYSRDNMLMCFVLLIIRLDIIYACVTLCLKRHIHLLY